MVIPIDTVLSSSDHYLNVGNNQLILGMADPLAWRIRCNQNTSDRKKVQDPFFFYF